jgi:hypothetical protein
LRSRQNEDAAASAAVPRINRFDPEPANRLTTGNDLFFTVAGSPAGKASIRIAGVKGKFFLQETQSGLCEGAYTVKSKDRIAADAAVTANLLVGSRDTSVLLGKSLVSAQLITAHHTSLPTCSSSSAQAFGPYTSFHRA